MVACTVKWHLLFSVMYLQEEKNMVLTTMGFIIAVSGLLLWSNLIINSMGLILANDETITHIGNVTFSPTGVPCSSIHNSSAPLLLPDFLKFI